MSETGAIKFRCDWTEADFAPFPGFAELNEARQELRRLGFLGVNANGVGFGNASLREGGSGSFYITGSGTGVLYSLGIENYAKVLAWDFEGSWLHCAGRGLPSAESLTHAAIYAMAREVRVVLHGHDQRLWRSLLREAPATDPEVEYGTPAMAREVERLFRETDVRDRKAFAMAGHLNGIVAFGGSAREALAGFRQSDDPWDLNRFVQAQEGSYARALLEIERGRKLSHWMWFVFPQYEGLGSSAMSRRFSIKSVAEAAAYLDHPVLGPRLRKCFEALFALEGLSANQIFGYPDDRKLQSCATLFASISPADSVFYRLLEKYFAGEEDVATRGLVER